jgi:hypothetical protein
MTTRRKIVLGGLGALTPVILNLITVDLRTVFNGLALIAVAGYLVRVLVLFYLGGLVAYLHKTESSPIKLFELGIVAPALITSMLNASNVSVPVASPPLPPHGSLIVPSAFAQPPDGLKQFTLPQESPAQQFFRGLTGSTTARVWFVITGWYARYNDAKKQADAINGKNIDLHAEVYAPARGKLYPVVIGANLTREEAERLRKAALDKKIVKEVSLWTFPD